MRVADYFSSLTTGRIVLWCYLIWWGVSVGFRFDPSPALWLNSLGLSAVIGLALLLSVGTPSGGARDGWQTFRLFAMPFCVSSFSSLIKGQGYVLVFPPRLHELALSVGACLAFVGLVLALRARRQALRRR